MSARLLLVDDQAALLDALVPVLERAGHTVRTATSVADARDQVAAHRPDVALLDRCLPDGDGSELAGELKARHPEIDVLVFTGHSTIPTAFESGQRGISAYLTKPVPPAALLRTIENVLARQRHALEVRSRRRSERRTPEWRAAAGDPSWASPAMSALQARLGDLAGEAHDVLLHGEPGTGKRVLARWLHLHGARAAEPFRELRCGLLDPAEAGPELFGTSDDAGAAERRVGLLALAGAGALVLHHVEALPLGVQARLPAARQELATALARPTPRLVLTAGDAPTRLVEDGRLAPELAELIGGASLAVPPLRERTEDLARLAGELLQELGQEHTGRTPPRLEADALAELGQWSWPGNVRELRTVLERALLASPDRVIRREDLERRRGLGEWHLTLGFPGPEGLRGTLQDVERQLIAEALARSATRQEAARRLQLSRYALARRMKALEIKG